MTLACRCGACGHEFAAEPEDVAVRRWCLFTGRAAVLASDGRLFPVGADA